MTNLTLSVDESTIARARLVAQAQGKSVQALVREFLCSVAGQDRGEALAERLQAGWAAKPANVVDGYKWRRTDGYDGRVVAGGDLDAP